MLAIPLELVGVAVRPLQRAESVALFGSLSHAVLSSNGARSEVAAILRRIDTQAVRKVQDKVLMQEILPMY